MLVSGIIYFSMEDELADPFVNWITVTLPFEETRNYLQIEEAIKSQMDVFEISEISTHHRIDFKFKNLNNGNWEYYRGSSISEQNHLLENILMDEGDFSDKTLGLIILEDFLHKLGYPEDTAFVGMTFKSGQEEVVAVPIIKSVPYLPSSNLFLFSNNFYYQTLKRGGEAFDTSGDNCLSIYVKTELIDEATDLINYHYTQNSNYDNVSIELSENDLMYPGYKLRILFDGICLSTSEQVNEEFRKLKILFDSQSSKITILQLKNYPNMRNYDDRKFREFTSKVLPPDMFSVNFKDLSKVRGFKDFLTHWNITIDDEKVRDKELFDKLRVFILFFAICILFFSSFGLYLFMKSKLTSHFKGISKQIGNYNAMGLKNSDMKKLYLKIVGKFILEKIAFTLLYSILGVLIIAFLLRLTSIINPVYVTYIKFCFLTILALSVGVYSMTYFIIHKRFNKILSKTPGELVYS